MFLRWRFSVHVQCPQDGLYSVGAALRHTEVLLSLKHFLPGLLALPIVCGYLAWTYHQRQQATTLELEHQAKEIRKAEWYNKAYGSDELKITVFVARSNPIRPGQKGLLCYGVQNATAVRLDPPVESIQPSPTRCFSVSAAKTTTYKLTAEDKAGHTVEQKLTLFVQ